MQTATRKPVFLLITGLIAAAALLASYLISSASQGRASTPDSGTEIEASALLGLEQIGWDITGFEAELAKLEGDFARVTIHSSNPPGGFSAILKRENATWVVVLHGSAMNPADLDTLGVPQSILTE